MVHLGASNSLNHFSLFHKSTFPSSLADVCSWSSDKHEASGALQCLPTSSICALHIMPSLGDEMWQIRKPSSLVIVERFVPFLKGSGMVMMTFLLSLMFKYNLLYNVSGVASPPPPVLFVHFNISSSLYFCLLRVPSPLQMYSPYPSL